MMIKITSLQRVLVLISVCVGSPKLSAQQLDVNRVELTGDHVILYYNLMDSVAGRTYSINLYSSRDNFLNPLTQVTGDLGIEVKPGIQRKVMWNAKQELGADFNDKVAIELRARIYIPFLRFDSFEKIKRGKPTQITWRGGTPQNILNFELYRNGKKETTIPNVPNAGHTAMLIPMSVKPGKGYSFRISDSKNKDLVVQTSTFAVKPKVPFLVKVLPLVVIGAVVPLVGGGGEGGEKSIPDPPSTPGN
jgi:hypothetical protein